MVPVIAACCWRLACQSLTSCSFALIHDVLCPRLRTCLALAAIVSVAACRSVPGIGSLRLCKVGENSNPPPSLFKPLPALLARVSLYSSRFCPFVASLSFSVSLAHLFHFIILSTVFISFYLSSMLSQAPGSLMRSRSERAGAALARGVWGGFLPVILEYSPLHESSSIHMAHTHQPFLSELLTSSIARSPMIPLVVNSFRR
jgi:hypothetical protein